MNELEQTKKVLDVIANLINENQTCTYRYLIYDLLGFKEDAYSELISGLTITNFLVYVKELEENRDKAIEYINENWGHWCSNHCKYASETINILRGEDNE